MLAYLPVPNDHQDAAHVHYNLKTGPYDACPNVFSEAVTEEHATYYGGMPCETPETSTFCYAPGEGEDLTGLLTENP